MHLPHTFPFREFVQRAIGRAGRALIVALVALAAPAAGAETAARGVDRAERRADLLNSLRPEEVLQSTVGTDRIIGGTLAEKGQWPTMVLVTTMKPGSDKASICGGTVIAPTWVLTAAHCVNNTLAADPAYRGVILEGATDLNARSGHLVKVAAFHIHPAYSDRLKLHDIALLQLAGPANAPAQKLVGKTLTAEAQKPGRMATVIGFGTTTEGGKASPHLRQVDLPIAARPDCQAIYGADRITDASLCAGFPQGGKDSCQGDSGGPLYITDRAGEKLQAGIVSYGDGCARVGVYGVYASVGSHEDWVKSLVPQAQFVAAQTTPSATETATEHLTPGADTVSAPANLGQVTIDISEGRRLKVGTFIRVRVTSSVAGQVVIYNDNPDGRSYQLYPSKAFPALGADPNAARIDPGQVLTIPSPQQLDDGYRFIIRPPEGENILRAIVVPNGNRVADIIRAHTDGETIVDLGAVLNDLVTAEKADRGVEAVRIAPNKKGSAELRYEIVR